MRVAPRWWATARLPLCAPSRMRAKGHCGKAKVGPGWHARGQRTLALETAARKGAEPRTEAPMAIAPIRPYERDLLRAQALVTWAQSQDLRRRAALARQHAEEVQWRAEAALEHSEEIIRRTARLLDAPGRTAVSLLVDRTIRGWGANGQRSTLDQTVGLVAAGEMTELIRLKALCGSRLRHVVGASDVGTALGLAIVTQPDLAVFDTRLELGSGVDLAMVLPLYAPRTRTLVLTDDPRQLANAEVVGLDAEHRHPSASALVSWIGELAV